MKTLLPLTLLVTVLVASPFATTAEAKQLRDVPVVGQHMRAGDVIREEDIVYRQMDISRLPGTLILDKKQLVGREAARSLVQGVPIRSDHVRTPPATRRGSDVTLRFQARGLILETTGRALEDGKVGDTIRVMNSQSSTVISGTVLESGLVAVN